MTRDEVRALLAYAAASTRDWAPTSVDVDVWLDLLGDLPYDDTRTALHDHAKASRYRPTPAELRDGVKRIRADRLARAVDQVPDADPDDPQGYVEALREDRYRTASGTRAAPLAITGTFPSPPPADWRPQLPTKTSAAPVVLPPVDDPERLAQARAEVAARQPIPLPESTEPVS